LSGVRADHIITQESSCILYVHLQCYWEAIIEAFAVDPTVGSALQLWTGDPRDLALRIAEILADTPASDTLVLDVHELSSVADYFVICSGENERQLRAISNDLLDELGEQRVRPHRTEGSPQSGWIVLDYGDSIVHIFDVDQRAYYRLESLWSEAQTLVAME
jgi:ribosome-associated protein